MKTAKQLTASGLFAAAVCVMAPSLHAGLIVNGGFEAGFSGWTRVDQIGSDGTFFPQTGTTSPVNGLPVPAPPAGTTAAMTDAAGPGAHVLYQDFVVPTGLSNYSLAFSLFIQNGGPDYFIPPLLDFATPALNQRARVDIMTATSDPFSLNAADVLQNIFETQPGAPLISGYTNLQFDVSALLQANQGATLRLRFTDVDNVAPFNLGVDNIDILAVGNNVPDTLSWGITWLTLCGSLVAGIARRRVQPCLRLNVR